MNQQPMTRDDVIELRRLLGQALRPAVKHFLHKKIDDSVLLLERNLSSSATLKGTPIGETAIKAPGRPPLRATTRNQDATTRTTPAPRFGATRQISTAPQGGTRVSLQTYSAPAPPTPSLVTKKAPVDLKLGQVRKDAFLYDAGRGRKSTPLPFEARSSPARTTRASHDVALNSPAGGLQVDGATAAALPAKDPVVLNLGRVRGGPLTASARTLLPFEQQQRQQQRGSGDQVCSAEAGSTTVSSTATGRSSDKSSERIGSRSSVPAKKKTVDLKLGKVRVPLPFEKRVAAGAPPATARAALRPASAPAVAAPGTSSSIATRSASTLPSAKTVELKLGKTRIALPFEKVAVRSGRGGVQPAASAKTVELKVRMSTSVSKVERHTFTKKHYFTIYKLFPNTSWGRREQHCRSRTQVGGVERHRQLRVGSERKQLISSLARRASSISDA